MEKNSYGIKENRPTLVPPRVPERIHRDVLSPLLSEYDTFISELQQQNDFYKTEHETLRKSLTDVIAENKCLSDRLKTEFDKKISIETILSPSHRKETDMVANLQRQLSLLSQERDSAVELWHSTNLQVDQLEDELRSSQDTRHIDVSQRKYDEMRKDFSQAVIMLEEKLNSTKSMLIKEKSLREEIEKKHEKCSEENISLTQALNSRQQELEGALEGQCASARKLQEVEKKAAELEIRADTFKIVENDLESALTQCHKHIDDLVKKNFLAQEKVKESLQLVECALAEKDAAIFSETKIREENARLQQMMANIVDEAGLKVKEEVETLKQQYNGKLKMLLHDMKKMEDECCEKDKMLRKEIQEKNILEGQLEQIQKEAPAATNVMERRLNIVHQELTDVRQTNLQLSIEKESLKSEMERLQESYAAETRRLTQENQALEQRMLVLQTHLETALQSRSEKDIHIEKLSQHIIAMEHEREKINLMSRKELQEWQQQQLFQQEQQQLMTQLQKIQKQSDATASELEHHLERQQTLKTKYQKAMKSLTEKFEKRIQELRNEASALKKENKSLEAKLSKIQKTLVAQRQSSVDDTENVK